MNFSCEASHIKEYSDICADSLLTCSHFLFLRYLESEFIPGITKGVHQTYPKWYLNKVIG